MEILLVAVSAEQFPIDSNKLYKWPCINNTIWQRWDCAWRGWNTKDWFHTWLGAGLTSSLQMLISSGWYSRNINQHLLWKSFIHLIYFLMTKSIYGWWVRPTQLVMRVQRFTWGLKLATNRLRPCVGDGRRSHYFAQWQETNRKGR